MPKLFWVALPLLLAAAWAAWQTLRRQAPSRHALNVWSSVLLLGYVLVTAGLGIFWVANQQLPVFDWHYLFGYGTVLLVALHLVFNFPSVWRHVTRPRAAPVRSQAPPGRRQTLGALGLLACSAASFWLGMRQGRSELRLDAASAAGSSAGTDASAGHALIERFHAFSSHTRAGVLLRAPGSDWGDAPPAFKHYPGATRLPLPSPFAPTRGISLATLSTVLWHTTGVTDTATRLKLRAAPSSGGLFSTELYVAVRDVPGLAPGIWHYAAEHHALDPVHADGVDAAEALGAAGEEVLRDAPAFIVATAVFRRTGHKYRDRTYRYVLADLGHALENLRLAAAVTGATPLLLGAFDEARAAATLRIDQAEEGVLGVLALGSGDRQQRTVPPPTMPRVRWQPQPLVVEGTTPLGVTAAVHTATSLQRVAPALPPQPPARPPEGALPSGAIVLSGVASTGPPVLARIAARRSVRRYAATPLRLEALSGVLAGLEVDRPLLSAALHIDVVAHSVDGLLPGAYRYQPAPAALLPRRAPADLRRAARAAALDQEVIGEAAAVFVFSIDRDVFGADPLGPARGYRHAFIEAGLVGERVYLEALARGLGACAVGAFYDEEAAALVGVDPAREWVVHFAALGVPAA